MSTRRILSSVMLIALISHVAFAQDETDLKVKRVAIFSSGVAHFDREAQVSDAGVADLRFRADQINDVLKSLVIQDMNGGSVGVVSYPSKDPIDKTLKSFGVDLTGKPSLIQILDQLRGEPVQIAGPKAMSGTIVGVEPRRMFADGEKFVEVDILNLLTDSGVQQLKLHELQGIKLTNDKVDAELRKALSTVAASHDADKKSITLRFDGTGTRQVRASYLVEAPIWKTSYRLVLSDENKPMLQGWAMVENATEEDWKDVSLSLISGRPISFRMDLYTPLYVPRPLEQLEVYASLRPATLDAGTASDAQTLTMSATLSDQFLTRHGTVSSLGFNKTQPSPGGQSVFSGGGGWADQLRYGAETSAGGNWLIGGNLISAASGTDAGELFEYRIKTPVSIPRRQAAMLPIVSEEVSADKLSVFNAALHPKHPLNSIKLGNRTALNLMQGPVTIFDGNLYAGDSKLPDMKPGDERMLGYALDLGMTVSVEGQSAPDEIVSLSIVKGVLYHKHRNVEEKLYVIKNKEKDERTLIIEHPIVADWTLLEPEKPFEKTDRVWRFKQVVSGNKSTTLIVRTERMLEQSLRILDGGLTALEYYSTSGVISKKVRESLEKAIALRTDLDRTSRELLVVRRDLNVAKEDQGRVRENLKSLQPNSDTHTRQMKRFDEYETQIENLAKRATELQSQEEQKRRAIEDFLAELDVE